MLADVAGRPRYRRVGLKRLHGLFGEADDALGRKHSATAHSDSATGWLNSEVAPSADVSVAVNEAGIAASLEASTVSENRPSPSASDVAATLPRNISPSPLPRSEEHTSELQSLRHLVCRLL